MEARWDSPAKSECYSNPAVCARFDLDARTGEILKAEDELCGRLSSKMIPTSPKG